MRSQGGYERRVNESPSYPPEDVLETHVQRLVRRFGRSVVQIFGVTPAGLPDPLGTAAVLTVAGKYLLMTAAHVLDPMSESTLYGGIDGGSLVEITGQAYFSGAPESGGHENDEIDVAFIDLSPETVLKLTTDVLLTPDDLDVNDRGRIEDVYVAMGYPYRKTKRVAGANVESKLYKYTTVLRPNLYAAERRDEATHVVLGFHRRSMRFEGRQQTAPDPGGMSGGPVFRLDNVGTPLISGVPLGRLVALLTDYSARNHVLIGPRVSVLVAYVRKALPDLSPHLPDPTRFRPVFKS